MRGGEESESGSGRGREGALNSHVLAPLASRPDFF